MDSVFDLLLPAIELTSRFIVTTVWMEGFGCSVGFVGIASVDSGAGAVDFLV